MARRIGITNLNASTLDILNVIRTNASYEYQQLVPEIKDVKDIPRVGEILYGYPSLANQFINALVNRIAMVKVKSATFNNAYAELKKGYLEFGETVEEVFVGIAKAREFSPEKAEKREFKRTIPDVKTAFHTMNWRVQYPVTIQNEDLRQAFTNVNGVQDLVAKIVDSVYTAAEYDEFLLFKYLMIKAITKGKMYPVSIGDGTMSKAAVAFRGMSNKITFLKTEYNNYGVHTSTPKNNQYIFMDAMYNAEYDVNVLAGAFNMEKAEFIGRLKLIDDWTTFDKDRFSVIIEESEMIEEITDDELALMKGVKAVLVDDEWFQVYDNMNRMTDTPVASGLYWNYFYNVWKTVSSSPFSNAIVFVTDEVSTALPANFTAKVSDVSVSDKSRVITLDVVEKVGVTGGNVQFIQTGEAVSAGVAIHKYGAIMATADTELSLTLKAEINGTEYTAGTKVTNATKVGDSIVFTKP